MMPRHSQSYWEDLAWFLVPVPDNAHRQKKKKYCCFCMYLFTVVEGYNSDRVCGRICVLMCVTCVGLQIHVFFYLYY